MVIESELLILEEHGWPSVASRLGFRRPCNFHFCTLGIHPPCKEFKLCYRMRKATWREILGSERAFWMFQPQWMTPGADELPG